MPGPKPRLPVIGDTFGLWTVIEHPFHEGKYWLVACRCECGAERPVKTMALYAGRSKMCAYGKHFPTEPIHGMCRMRDENGKTIRNKFTPEFEAWRSMKKRCLLDNFPQFKDWGGRGITFCERWKVFSNFLADVGMRPGRGYSLDRYPNVNGNYEPGNVRWANRIEQQNNTTQNHFLEHGGKRMTIADWARETGADVVLLYSRVRQGWDDARILTEPVHNTARHRG